MRHLEQVETCDSTQDLARDLFLKGHHRFVWVSARRQSRGRGRQGREWLNDDGRAPTQTSTPQLLCSVAFATQVEERYKPQVSLIAGLALFDALSRWPQLRMPEFFLKWPNDLIFATQVGGLKKIAGVLAESPKRQLLVVGWGVNLETSPAQVGHSGNLLECTGFAPVANELLTALIERFENEISLWEHDPATAFATVIQRLKQGAMRGFWGREGMVSPQQFVARAEDLDPSGALLVRIAGNSDQPGDLQLLHSGEFRFRLKEWI